MISIPYNVSFHFDEQLHEVPNAPEEMQSAIEFLRSMLPDISDMRQQIALYGLLGSYARILCDFSTAEAALTTAIALSEELQDERLKTLNQIRLAHLYQWQQRFDESDRLFTTLLYRCQHHPALESYLDFVYQHLGKSQFDQANYVEAQRYFQQALTRRLRKGNRTLIGSTEFALKMTRQQLANSPPVLDTIG